MLVSAYGVSTGFGKLGEIVIRALMKAIFADSHFVNADTIEDMKSSVYGKKTSNIVLYSYNPERNLTLIAEKLNPKAIVFYEEPIHIVRYHLSAGNIAPIEAFRIAGKHISTMAEILGNNKILLISNSASKTLRQLMAEIAAYFKLVISPAAEDKCVELLNLTGREQLDEIIAVHIARLWPQESSRIDAGDPVDEKTWDAIQNAMYCLDDIDTCQIIKEIVWNNDIFFSQDNKRNMTVSTGGVVEMLGPARYIYFGPYLHLPYGQWSMSADFIVGGNLSGNKLEFDVFQSGEVLSFGSFEIPAQGVFEITTGIMNEHPEKPLEFRIFLKEGAIEGSIRLNSVRWRHHGFAGRSGR